MKKEDNHIAHYLVLGSGLGLLGLIFVLFRHNTPLQIGVGFLGCIFYAIWGIFHHALEDRVTKMVVLEYSLFSLLAFLLMVLFVTI